MADGSAMSLLYGAVGASSAGDGAYFPDPLEAYLGALPRAWCGKKEGVASTIAGCTEAHLPSGAAPSTPAAVQHRAAGRGDKAGHSVQGRVDGFPPGPEGRLAFSVPQRSGFAPY